VAFDGGHINAGFTSPTNHPLVKLAFEGAKRLAIKGRKNQKEPFTAEIISKLVSEFGSSDNLMHLRFLVICITGFAGFFRISELLNIKIRNLEETKESFEIFVEKSKTDQLREGHTVFIAKSGMSTCPVYWLKKYLSLTNLRNEPESYLICRLAKTKKGHNVLGNHQISYDSARKTFIDHYQSGFSQFPK